jgi:hypothetical protein
VPTGPTWNPIVLGRCATRNWAAISIFLRGIGVSWSTADDPVVCVQGADPPSPLHTHRTHAHTHVIDMAISSRCEGVTGKVPRGPFSASWIGIPGVGSQIHTWAPSFIHCALYSRRRSRAMCSLKPSNKPVGLQTCGNKSELCVLPVLVLSFMPEPPAPPKA